MKCPICGAATTREYRPFCSSRCADIDLGRWLGGHYVIPGAGTDEEQTPDLSEKSSEDKDLDKN